MHITEYTILGFLWYRALHRADQRWRAWDGCIAFALCVLFAGLDEYHQTFVPTRTGSLVAVGWDSFGATLAIVWRVIAPDRKSTGR